MRRLFVVYGAALTSAVLVALIVPLGLLAGTLAHDRAVSAARQQAQGLTVLAASPNRARLRETVQALNQTGVRTTVFLPDGTVIGAPAPRTPSIALAGQGVAFTATANGGEEILQPVAGPHGVAVIRAFVPASALRSGVLTAWATLAATGAFLLGAAVLLGAALARRLSRSVTLLSDVAERVGAGDLAATVEPAGPPEVASVGRVLNGLGARITGMLAQERQLSADLSHRLRTPVTALRLDVESLTDPAERARMTAHVEALAAAVDAAVRASRTPVRRSTGSRCDAGDVVGRRAEFWSVLAAETGRPFCFRPPEQAVPVGVSDELLGAAVDVLVDNVFSHTPPGTWFALTVTTTPQGCVEVVVEDAGPGIRSPEVPRRGRNGVGSTGLGLDVARRTAEQAGGAVTVRPGEAGGACVVMTLPTVLAEP